MKYETLSMYMCKITQMVKQQAVEWEVNGSNPESGQFFQLIIEFLVVHVQV